MASTFMDEALSFLPVRYRKVALPWLVGIIVAALVIFGSKSLYDRMVEARNEEVSTHYWQLSAAVDDGDLEAAEEAFSLLAEDATDEQYSLAAMVLAGGAFSEESLDRAEGLYREVIDMSDQTSLRDAARTRLAKVLLAKEDHETAKQELIQVESVGMHFSVVVSDLLGDISVAEGDLDEAESHYREGLTLLAESGDEQLSALLRSKLSMVISLRLQEAGS